jgi:hypothetical protein
MEKKQNIETPSAVPQTESETIGNWRSAGKLATIPKMEPAPVIANEQSAGSKKSSAADGGKKGA